VSQVVTDIEERLVQADVTVQSQSSGGFLDIRKVEEIHDAWLRTAADQDLERERKSVERLQKYRDEVAALTTVRLLALVERINDEKR
jgi:hypothetical protein